MSERNRNAQDTPEYNFVLQYEFIVTRINLLKKKTI